MYVIGVAGQAQMGKDTLADRLVRLLNQPWHDEHAEREYGVDMHYPYKSKLWTRSAFAKGVKKVFTDAFDTTFEFVEEWKVKPEPPPGFEMNVRKSLQFIGDGFRQIRPTVWLDLALRGNEPRIISDVRYINEFRRVHEEGGLNILVGRTEKLNDDPNASEAQIKPYVVWCLENLPNDVTFNPARWDYRFKGRTVPEPPPHMEMFDIFIRNDKALEEYYSDIAAHVLPYVQKFEFKEKA
jgi:hypothetical protein